jgi:hypothetical protein
MNFLKRLFGGGGREKDVPPPMKGGISAEQALRDREGQGAARKRMEDEVASDRERRGATDERPGGSA